MSEQKIQEFLPEGTALAHKDLLSVVYAMRDYIDAIPNEIAEAFPAMPGFDRDLANTVIEKTESLSSTTNKGLISAISMAQGRN